MRTILLPTVFIAAVSPSLAGAQPSPRDRWADTARVAIEAAYNRGDVEQLRSARAVVERALTAFADDPLLQHYYAYSLYREATLDRKSTRLNSSHSQISYAVFCLKKKTAP